MTTYFGLKKQHVFVELLTFDYEEAEDKRSQTSTERFNINIEREDERYSVTCHGKVIVNQYQLITNCRKRGWIIWSKN